jgi:hypothetical protein
VFFPPNPKFLHFSWALAFMQTYPTNDTSLTHLLGGSDPKRISKYVWPFIPSIFALNKTVVSILLDCCLLMTPNLSIQLTCLQVFALRFNLITGRREMSEMTVCYW